MVHIRDVALPNPVDEHRSQGLVTQRLAVAKAFDVAERLEQAVALPDARRPRRRLPPNALAYAKKNPERSPPPKLDKLGPRITRCDVG